MIKFFRRIRKSLVAYGDARKYLLYALGEILLVVIGILIALQINNWNEVRKERKYEHYILIEIRNNLEADKAQINKILTQRQKTQQSIQRMRKYLKTQEINKDTFAYDLVQLFTFERYFPIRTAYEVSKSKGLPISNPELRTKIANYYEFEQYKVQSSIKDIERVFLNEFQFAYEHYLVESEYGVKVVFNKYPDPALNKWVQKELIKFQPNNSSTTEKVGVFQRLSNKLLEEVSSELQKF